MTFKKSGAVAFFIASVTLAGCQGEAKAGNKPEAAAGNKPEAAEAAQSVEFYLENFAERLTTESKCNRNPDIVDTVMCINVRRAANEIRAEFGRKPKYPEVGDGGQ